MAKKINIKIFGLSFFIALQAAFCVYFRWIPFDILSKRAFVILLALTFAFTPLIYQIILRFIAALFSRYGSVGGVIC